MCEQEPTVGGEHRCVWRTIVEEIEQISPDGVEVHGQTHLVPAFRTVQARDVMIHIANIVNPRLHGTDAYGKPLPKADTNA